MIDDELGDSAARRGARAVFLRLMSFLNGMKGPAVTDSLHR